MKMALTHLALQRSPEQYTGFCTHMGWVLKSVCMEKLLIVQIAL